MSNGRRNNILEECAKECTLESLLQNTMPEIMWGEDTSNSEIRYIRTFQQFYELVKTEILECGVLDNPLYKYWKEQYDIHKSKYPPLHQHFNSTYRMDLMNAHTGMKKDFLNGLRGKADRSLIRTYISCFIPSWENIEFIQSKGPIIEIGAGLGYVSKLVAESGKGCLIDSYDINPNPRNKLTFGNVKHGSEEVLIDYPERTLLLSYPVRKGHKGKNMAYNCITKYFQGNHLIFVGEYRGEYRGSVGTEEFFDELENNWILQETKAVPRLPHDYSSMFYYERKNPFQQICFSAEKLKK